jgi:penicillin-binding protein 1A
MGNDNYAPTKRMTGGTIPALIWHNVMAYAHQGIKLRPLPGLPSPQHAPTVANAAFAREPTEQRVLLTQKGTETLLHLERVFDEASHALTVQSANAGKFSTRDTGERRASTLTAASNLNFPK